MISLSISLSIHLSLPPSLLMISMSLSLSISLPLSYTDTHTYTHLALSSYTPRHSKTLYSTGPHLFTDFSYVTKNGGKNCVMLPWVLRKIAFDFFFLLKDSKFYLELFTYSCAASLFMSSTQRCGEKPKKFDMTMMINCSRYDVRLLATGTETTLLKERMCQEEKTCHHKT